MALDRIIFIIGIILFLVGNYVRPRAMTDASLVVMATGVLFLCIAAYLMIRKNPSGR